MKLAPPLTAAMMCFGAASCIEVYAGDATEPNADNAKRALAVEAQLKGMGVPVCTQGGEMRFLHDARVTQTQICGMDTVSEPRGDRCFAFSALKHIVRGRMETSFATGKIYRLPPCDPPQEGAPL
jgi:hypothetical protein